MGSATPLKSISAALAGILYQTRAASFLIAALLYTMEISEMLEKVQPFDLIVFRNTGFIGRVISFVEWVSCGAGEISHVGCVISRDVCPLIEGDGLYIFESNVDAPRSGDRKGSFGVQIRPLEATIERTLRGGGSIGWCQLHDGLNPWLRRRSGAGYETDEEYARRREVLRWEVSRFYFTYANAIYDFNPLSLLGGAFPFMRRARDHVISKMKFLNMHKWMFCSELIALLYIRLGVLDGARFDAQDVIPVDFISGVDVDGMVSPVKAPIWIHITPATPAAPATAPTKSAEPTK